MEFIETQIKDLLIVKSQVFSDNRGYFYESFNANKWKDAGVKIDVLQTNISKSQKGVVRGLHFQNPPFAQGKLIRVISGAVLDVAVDIRKKSPTYGEHFAIELSEQNKLALWIPPGFAHGFKTLQDETIFFYDCTNVYNKESEGSIRWDDPTLNIDWNIDEPLLSEKDKQAPSFKDINSVF